jgi:signal transduction histidine kinase
LKSFGWLFALQFLLFNSFNLEAQFYHSTTYDQQDGLSSQYVWDISQDDKGRMLFLTQNGLDIYDGFKWQSIKQTQDGVFLPSKRLSRIIKNNDDGFWVAGVNNYENFTILYYDFSTGEWQNYLNPVNVQQDAYFSAISEYNGVRQFLMGSINVVYYKADEAQKWNKLEIDKEMGLLLNVDFIDNSPHVFTEGGIYKVIDNRLIKQTYEFEQLANFKKLGPIIELKKELSGELALIGERGIGKTLGKKLDVFISLKKEELLTSSFRNAQFEVHPDYDVITLFNSKLYGRFFGDEFKNLLSQDDGTFSWANRFFIDRQQILWLATDRGIKKFSNLNFESYNKLNGLQDFEVTSINALSSDKLFFGSNFGWQIFENGEFIEKNNTAVIDYELSHRIQETVFFNNKIYAASTKLGLIEINQDNTFSVRSSKDVQSVTVHNNQLYFMDRRNAIYKMDDQLNIFAAFDLKNGFRKYFRRLYSSNDNKLFAIGIAGIVDVETDKLVFGLQSEENVQLVNTYDLIDYDDQYYLVATLAGVHLLNKTTYEVQKNWHGISHPVYALLKSKDQKATYLGTDRGVYIISADGEKSLFTTKDGLLGNEVNRDALFEDDEGKIWIGSSRGLNILSPEMLESSVEPPIVGVESVYNLTRQEELIDVKDAKIKPDNSLAIRFYVSGFYDEDRLELRYRLSDKDEWIYEVGNLNGEKLFYSLSNGSYRFQIQAREARSEWSEVAYSPVFNVMPAYYQRLWFFILVSVVAAVMVFISLLLVHYRNQEARLNAELDVRTKKLLDQQLRLEQQNKELLESNKSLDQFTSAVSHDLKSPLNSSIGLLELLDDSYSQEELLRFTGMVTNNLKKMKNFIIELIELSRNANQGVKFEALDLKKTILDVFDLFDQTPIQKSVDKRLLINGDAPFLGDKSRLNVVFSNLISNSINYHNPSAENPYCDIRIDILEEEVFITVRDNGKGIPKKYQSKIFDMFFRAETSVSGTGLGLFLVKEVIDKMGGTIKVNSEEGMGTTFYIILPNGAPLSKRVKTASSGLPSKSDKPISFDFNDEKFSSKT